MPDYQNGKIYKIVCNTTGLVYYGSTCEPTLARRLAGHKHDYTQWKKDAKEGYMTSFSILDTGNYCIVLVELCPCKSKMELHQRERFYIENNDCVNKIVPTRTIAEWRESAREHISEYGVEYYLKNKERIAIVQIEYRKNNTEKIAEYQLKNKERVSENKRRSYLKNKEKWQELYRENYSKNKEIVAEYHREHYLKNKEKVAEYQLKNKEEIAKYARERYLKNIKKKAEQKLNA